MSTTADNVSTRTLADALFPRTRQEVLKHLIDASDGLHLRELERRTGLNSRHLMRELHSLRDAGLLAATKVGNQVIYRMNPACPIVNEISSIIRKTIGLAGTLREILKPVAGRFELAYIYGSLAAGGERSDSDIDLMIVGDVGLRELSPYLAEMQRETGREISPTLYAPHEYSQGLSDPDSFVQRVHDGPRINLFGGDG